ncbi:unnamed protein product [Candidula unifasciata]|uniref:Methyltransferase like 21D n=1 Tax=Candidula unifasciata TaxID=100452 RepID=A0A8S3ZXS3_9EUPU|nr:unnamed protein product [Candidula unifasciata]
MTSVNLTELFSRCFELKNGTELILHQSAVGDVGCVVWDAAIVLCSYFVKCAGLKQGQLYVDSLDFQGKSMLDLGSGTGAVGLVTACLGARAIVTDLPDFVPLMQYNITENKGKFTGSCSAEPLRWGDREQMSFLKQSDFPHGADFIVLADCVYYEESLESLVETILYFSSERTHVYCSFEERDMGNKPELQQKFFQMMRTQFDITKVPLSAQDPDYSSADIHVLHCVLKTSLCHVVFLNRIGNCYYK